MMGVCIKGMEMPKKGYRLILIHADGTVQSTDGETTAVSVQEPHGRLIDAEQLKETLDYYIREAGWSDEINKALNWVKDEFINSAPTIIPESEVAD